MEFPKLLLGALRVVALLIVGVLGPTIGRGDLPVLGVDAIPPCASMRPMAREWR